MSMVTWTIEIADLQTESRVGIWPHEQQSQPVRVSLTLRATAAAFPQTIDECLDYEPLCKWICGPWAARAHTSLLETRVRELTDFVFGYDARIEWAVVAIVKVNAVPHAGGVSISVTMSRGEHEASFRTSPVTSVTQGAANEATIDTGIRVDRAECART
ncbi:MAG: hypothetical protein NVSMB6_23720 [Burkholderiaceae bacterium]